MKTKLEFQYVEGPVTFSGVGIIIPDSGDPLAHAAPLTVTFSDLVVDAHVSLVKFVLDNRWRDEAWAVKRIQIGAESPPRNFAPNTSRDVTFRYWCYMYNIHEAKTWDRDHSKAYFLVTALVRDSGTSLTVDVQATVNPGQVPPSIEYFVKGLVTLTIPDGAVYNLQITLDHLDTHGNVRNTETWTQYGTSSGGTTRCTSPEVSRYAVSGEQFRVTTSGAYISGGQPMILPLVSRSLTVQ